MKKINLLLCLVLAISILGVIFTACDSSTTSTAEEDAFVQFFGTYILKDLPNYKTLVIQDVKLCGNSIYNVNINIPDKYKGDIYCFKEELHVTGGETYPANSYSYFTFIYLYDEPTYNYIKSLNQTKFSSSAVKNINDRIKQYM